MKKNLFVQLYLINSQGSLAFPNHFSILNFSEQVGLHKRVIFYNFYGNKNKYNSHKLFIGINEKMMNGNDTSEEIVMKNYS